MHEVIPNNENTIPIMLPGRAGAVEGDFNVYNERFVAGVLTSTNIDAVTTITESPTAPGLFYVSWNPTAEQVGGAIVLKHIASGDAAAESIVISKSRTKIRNIEAATYPTKDTFNGTAHILYDPDDVTSIFATYTRTAPGGTVTWTR